MTRVTRTAGLVVAAVLLGWLTFLPAQQLPAPQFDRLARLCWPAVLEIPEFFEVGRIPVGCEVIDCCPGCPGPPVIDWRIRVSGAPLQSAEVTFENLAADRAGAMRVEGDAQMDGGRVRLAKGETTIRGLPRATSGRPAVGHVRLNFDKSYGAAELARPDDEGTPDAGQVEVWIEQLIGRVIVNEYRLRFDFVFCRPGRQDRIDLDNNDGNDQAVVLLDARRSGGCVDDEVRRGNDVITLGNVLSNGSCRSEVIVFSDDDAMQLRESVTAWTDNTGDLLRVNQTPNRLLGPVTVWLARNNANAIAQADIANANLLYNTNNTGIGFNPTFNNVAGNTNAVNTINASAGCGNLGALQGSAFFTAGRLNVYYVGGAFTGVNCNANRNIQFIGTTANNQSLAHEFGHSMSLGHTNNLAAFPLNNLMIGGGANRTHISEGQAFRFNAHCSSTLNANGTRAAAVRNCNNTIAGNVACAPGTDTHCPALGLDVQPK